MKSTVKATYAQTFNKIASLYDSARIGYPPQIYEIINLHSQIDQDSKILEIGCGSGIATLEIFEKWKPRITAIDPGEKLIGIAQKKTEEVKGTGVEKIEYLSCSFEDFSNEEKFDAIFSATAFHWPDKRTKYQKASDLLKEEGKLILFWNNYIIEEENIFSDIQNIYKEFHPDGSDNEARLHYKNKIRERKNQINNSKLFELIVHYEYKYSVLMNSRQYIDLLKSFSNNSYWGDDRLERFYSVVKNFILTTGDQIKISVIVNLEIAGKI